jgi:hypothetical protein
MDDLSVLTALKFVAAAIALASTVWGMTRTISADDGTGRKSLTSAGQIAVAMAVGAFLVAATSHGFETMVKRDADAQARLKALQETTQQEIRDARAFRTDQNARRAADVAEINRAEGIAQDARRRAAEAEARVLEITNAEIARARDLLLARDVNRGSSQNLARTSAALLQIDRVLNPISDLVVTVTWELPLNNTMPELRATVASADPDNLSGQQGVRGMQHSRGRVLGFEFNHLSEHYPRLFRHPQVATALVESRGKAGFFARRPASGMTNLQTVELADLFVALAPATNPELRYDVRRDTLSVSMNIQGSMGRRESGELTSVRDLGSATLLLSIWNIQQDMRRAASMMRKLRPTCVIVTASGRTFRAAREEIAPFATSDELPIFAVRLRRFEVPSISSPLPGNCWEGTVEP